jgi:cytochrome bd-type quinol oxidase subunit 1
LAVVVSIILAAHLAAMGIATAAPWLSLWLDFRLDRRPDDSALDWARFLAAQSVWAVVIGSVLGFVLVAALAAQGDETFFSGLAAVPNRRLIFGGLELAFFAASMAGYLALWKRRPSARAARRLLAFIGATNLLYHFPPLFAAITVLARRPELADETLTSRLFLELLVDPQVMARTAHFLGASITAGGLLVIGRAAWRRPPPGAESWTRFGACVGLIGAALQWPTGFYFLMSLDRSDRLAVMGRDAASTLLFVVGVAGAMGLLYQLGQMVMSEATRARRVRTVVLACLVFLAMSGLRVRANRIPAPIPSLPPAPTAQ